MAYHQRVTLPVVNTIPASLGAEDVNWVSIGTATRVDINIGVSAGTGDVVLLRWDPIAWNPIAAAYTGAWYPFGYPSTKMTVDATKFSGRANFRYEVGKDQYSQYCLLVPIGIDVNYASILGVDG